jgi:hypothetical protein
MVNSWTTQSYGFTWGECYLRLLLIAFERVPSFLRHFHGVEHDFIPEIDTFFYEKLRRDGPVAVARWLPNVASCRHLFVPLHFSSMHWALGIVMNLNASTLHEVIAFTSWLAIANQHHSLKTKSGDVCSYWILSIGERQHLRFTSILSGSSEIYIANKKIWFQDLQIFVPQTECARVFSANKVSLCSLWSWEVNWKSITGLNLF